MLREMDEMELLASVNPEPDVTGNPWSDEAPVLELPPPRRRRRRAFWIGGTATVAAAALIAGALLLADDDPTRPVATDPAGPGTNATTPTTVWSDPVRDPSTVVHRMAAGPTADDSLTWQDPLDASVGWADVKHVDFNPDWQAHWYIDLAARPPHPRSLEPGLLIAYGLVLDTTDDGVADYLIGIDNDAPTPGDLHVWVTNLETGHTDEQIGPPYGFPIEFSHPNYEGGSETVVFTFLGGSGPDDLDPATVRFYAWSWVTRNGEVIANDYAPDTGWITATP